MEEGVAPRLNVALSPVELQLNETFTAADIWLVMLGFPTPCTYAT